MIISAKDKAAIRRYYAGQYKLRFLEDGTVEAKRAGSDCYGILYTPRDTESHIQYLRDHS